MKGEFILNGETYKVDTEATLRITDPEAARYTVAADIGHWGALWGEALQQHGEAEAELDHWRARQLKSLLESEEKVAEWKAKTVVDSMPEYLERRKAVAACERMVTLARCQFEAFKAKAEVLKGLSYREHGEERMAGMVGREAEPAPEERAPAPAARSTEDDPRVKKLAEKHATRAR